VKKHILKVFFLMIIELINLGFSQAAIDKKTITS